MGKTGKNAPRYVLDREFIPSEETFTIMDNTMFRDKDLGLKERGLLATMVSLPRDFEMTIPKLANFIGCGEKTVRSTLRALEQAGYLRREQTRDSNGRYGYVYRMLIPPQK